MSERIISENVLSTKVLGSANPIAMKFRSLKSSIGGLCIAPILIIIALVVLFYGEKFERSSETVEALSLENATEVTGKTGMHKITGQVLLVSPANKPEIGDVLYYSYKKQHYEEVEKKETKTVREIENGKEVEKEVETIKMVDEWVDKENETKWADFKLGEIKVSPEKAKIQFNFTKKVLIPASGQVAVNFEQICQSNGGTWISAYNECEKILPSVCSQYGGTYNSCDSPCRHNANTQGCMQVCVEVCKFVSSDTTKYVEVASEESMTPKLGDYRIIFEYVPKDANLIVVGEISQNTINSGDVFIVSNKTDAELISDLKTSENIMYWALKILSWFLLTMGFASLFGPIIALLNFIPIAGKAASCAGGVVGGVLSLIIVVLGTLFIRYWWVFVVLVVVGMVVGIGLLIVQLSKRKNKK
jgi:hypothetical protein